MKKLLAVILSLLLLAGCAKKPQDEKKDEENNYVYGMWVSCFELEKLSKGGFKEQFEILADNAEKMGLNTLFVHTRAFESCIYNSKLFPLDNWCEKENYDVLEFMINTCKNHNLEFHAWINPYRLSSSSDAVLSEKLSYLKENEDYCKVENGVYLNPASIKTQMLIINGIKELLSKYDIDGIHFDDYFYPTTDSSFDSISYENYAKASENPLILADFRRAQVNVMISGVKQAIKASQKDILFSVSPAADIDRNYNELYADVRLWCKEAIIDAIIPQIYFGFNYPTEKFCFENLVIEWINCTKDTSVLLYIGLSPYKLGTETGPDGEEWKNGTDVVANQLKNIFAKSGISGFSLFSYSSISNNGELYTIQRENIKREILQKKGERI